MDRKKRNGWKRLTALLLCILYGSAIILSTTGCGRTAAEVPSAEGTEEGSSTEETESSVAAMGRYMESTTPLPDGADSEGRTMTMLSDNRLAYFDAAAGLLLSEDEGKSWSPAETYSNIVPRDGFVNNSSIAPDGSLILCHVQSLENQELVYNIIGMDTAGNKREVLGQLEDGDYINKVFAKSETECFGSTVSGKICSIDWENGKVNLLFTLSEQPEMMAFAGTQLLCLGNSGGAIYDIEQGSMLEKDTVLDDYCKNNLKGRLNNTSGSYGGIVLPGEEDTLYIADSSGLYRHVRNGNVMEQLVEGSFSSFGDPMLGMCAMVRLESGEFLLLTTGEDLIRFTYDPNEPTVPEKQLKIYSLEENFSIKQAMALFQKQNPDVYVKYEYTYAFLEKDSSMTVTDALKNLNVELLSGTGPDVILLDGMDASVYSGKGMLADLSPVLKELVDQQAVFENIASAYKQENGTFVIPASFSLPLLFGRQEDVEAVKDMDSLAAVVEKLRQENPESSITGAFSARQELLQLMEVNSVGWLDGKELDTQAVSNFLNQALRIYKADMQGVSKEELEVWGETERAWSLGGLAALTVGDKIKIMAGTASNMLMDMGAVSKVVDEQGYVFDLWPGEEGTGYLPMDKLAVSASSTQQEQAVNFVKLMLGEEYQKMNTGSGFPVNRAAFDSQDESDGEMSMGTGWKVGGKDMQFSYGYPTEAVTTRVKELAQNAEISLEGNVVLEEAVVEFGVQVLTGSMSVEQAVKEIQQKTAIYLSE